MTNYNKRLDEILAKHNGELGVTWEDPDVVTPDTKQAILRWVADEVIGRNTDTKSTETEIESYDLHVQNLLKEEQRKILAQHGYKGDSDER